MWHSEGARLRRLNQGAAGAHLISPFQCELCWFRNLEGKDPEPGVHDQAIACIRRSNLDNIAGRAPSTIWGHLMETRSIVDRSARFGLSVPLHALGPLPVGDPYGMGVAVAMQIKSVTAKGRIVSNPQFSTVRGLRGTATLNWQASPGGVGESASFAKNKGRVRPTRCPTQSDWFYQCLLGMELRLGSQSQPDQAVRMGAIVHLLSVFFQPGPPTFAAIGFEHFLGKSFRIGERKNRRFSDIAVWGSSRRGSTGGGEGVVVALTPPHHCSDGQRHRCRRRPPQRLRR